MVGDSPPDFVRELWLEVRSNAVEQAHRACRSAEAWALDGNGTAWDALVDDAHQLAGSLGSFGQWEAAAAAAALDGLLHEDSPDPTAVVEAAVLVRDALDRT